MFHRRLFYWMLALLCGSTLALAGCSKPEELTEVAPVMAAEALQLGEGDCLAPPRNLKLIPPAEMSLNIFNTDETALYVNQLTHDHGGYCIVSNTSYQGKYKYATLTLTLPLTRFQDVQQAMQGLGQLSIQSIPNELQRTIQPTRDWDTFVNLTLHLRPILTEPISNVEPQPQPVPDPPPAVPVEPPSRAFQTFESAFGVTTGIFAFVLDITIWILVVAGPFIVLTLIIRWIYSRYWPWGIVERPIRRQDKGDEE